MEVVPQSKLEKRDGRPSKKKLLCRRCMRSSQFFRFTADLEKSRVDSGCMVHDFLFYINNNLIEIEN